MVHEVSLAVLKKYWNMDNRDDRKYDGVRTYFFSEGRVGSEKK